MEVPCRPPKKFAGNTGGPTSGSVLAEPPKTRSSRSSCAQSGLLSHSSPPRRGLFSLSPLARAGLNFARCDQLGRRLRAGEEASLGSRVDISSFEESVESQRLLFIAWSTLLAEVKARASLLSHLGPTGNGCCLTMASSSSAEGTRCSSAALPCLSCRGGVGERLSGVPHWTAGTGEGPRAGCSPDTSVDARVSSQGCPRAPGTAASHPASSDGVEREAAAHPP
mmetsp:Transcript_67414/g.197122  ORF Transcript_67414/g.197122 Transcript_67414/m.197122 type:complete len:224 (+) Transcript_67414:333-1004(+)